VQQLSPAGPQLVRPAPLVAQLGGEPHDPAWQYGVVAGHATALAHCRPSALQVCTPLSEHRTSLGVQMAPHVPEVIDPFCHVPFARHVCGVVPLQPVAGGVQTAPHVPATTAPPCHMPLESHVCGTAPLHVFACGVQTPWNWLLTHA
jgi:hypothetical protein